MRVSPLITCIQMINLLAVVTSIGVNFYTIIVHRGDRSFNGFDLKKNVTYWWIYEDETKKISKPGPLGIRTPQYVPHLRFAIRTYGNNLQQTRIWSCIQRKL